MQNRPKFNEEVSLSFTNSLKKNQRTITTLVQVPTTEWTRIDQSGIGGMWVFPRVWFLFYTIIIFQFHFAVRTRSNIFTPPPVGSSTVRH